MSTFEQKVKYLVSGYSSRDLKQFDLEDQYPQELNLLIIKLLGHIFMTFDLIHPGYVKMFEDARKHCTHLTVALHENPNTENNKLSPTQTIEEREQILMALENVDDVRTYNSEYALSEYLKVGKFDVRFLGDDYKDKEEYTGKDLDLKVVFLDRSHGYSTTKLKKKISEDFK